LSSGGEFQDNTNSITAFSGITGEVTVGGVVNVPVGPVPVPMAIGGTYGDSSLFIANGTQEYRSVAAVVGPSFPTGATASVMMTSYEEVEGSRVDYGSGFEGNARMAADIITDGLSNPVNFF
jgi:hypothetical protein